jgi:hypothetical protein
MRDGVTYAYRASQSDEFSVTELTLDNTKVAVQLGDNLFIVEKAADRQIKMETLMGQIYKDARPYHVFHQGIVMLKTDTLPPKGLVQLTIELAVGKSNESTFGTKAEDWPLSLIDGLTEAEYRPAPDDGVLPKA